MHCARRRGRDRAARDFGTAQDACAQFLSRGIVVEAGSRRVAADEDRLLPTLAEPKRAGGGLGIAILPDYASGHVLRQALREAVFIARGIPY